VYSPTQEAVITALPEYWAGTARPQLWAALVAALILLVASCIAASNLFLSRTLARAREVATRRSLGATTLQIASQFGVESFTAASIAAVGGAVVAWVLVKCLVAWAPADIPRIADTGFDSNVLVFASVISLLTAFGCSVTPALIATRLGAGAVLRDGGGRVLGRRRG